MFFKVAQQGQNKIWQYFIGIVAVALGALIGQIPLGAVLLSGREDSNLNQENWENAVNSADFVTLGINSNIGLVLMLLSFVGALIAMLLIMKPLHKRSAKTLITSRSSIDWSRVFFAFFVWFGLNLATEFIMYLLDPGNYSWQFDMNMFLPLLAISLFILPMQTSIEEIFTRGYLMQGIGLASKTRWLPLILTSVLFGVLHLSNPEVRAFGTGVMMSYYIGVGLMLGILTIMDDGLELALGIHAATNIYGATLVTFKSSALQTAAMFSVAYVNINVMVLGLLVAATLFIVLCKWKYGWGSFSKIFAPIEKLHGKEEIALEENLLDKTEL